WICVLFAGAGRLSDAGVLVLAMSAADVEERKSREPRVGE
ncbi:hypothetical protein A2U01_0098330, partial [Trifolium medium]|nr:hypothetical protein [Trifolium medium]